MDLNPSNRPVSEKCWIRRHKILALLAPFFALILFLVAWLGIRGACVPSGYGTDPGPLRRFVSGAYDGFAFSVFSWIAFVEDWVRLTDHYWFSYPVYALPAAAFLFARKNRTAVFAYVLFCLLVCAAFFSGIAVIGRVME